MTDKNILNAISQVRQFKSETDKIEVKTASSGFPKKCYDTISSFANKNGGIIIFGINEENNFESEDIYDVKDLQKQLSSLCSDSMEPKIRPNILPIKFEGKNILAIKIDELPQTEKPCYYKPKGLKGGSYIRVGDSDDLMTDYEIYSLESYNNHIIEDKRLNKNADIDDLNIENINDYINKIKIDKPNFSKNSFEKKLKICGIADNLDGKMYPTLAGTLIFGEFPQSFYPQLFVACVHVPGKKLGDIGSYGERFIDNKRVEGTIEEMLEETMNFLRRNMKTSVIIDENGKRINRTEYPLEALREAVANALIHRDYSAQTESAFISVYMYEDRIEIINPGALYGTNKLEKLGTDNIMEARNPTIVRILEEKGSVIENRHSGIPTMKREMEKYNLPLPEFYEERGSFKVIFRNDSEKNNIQQKVSSGQQNVASGQQNVASGQQNVASGQQNVASGQQKVASGQQKVASGQQKVSSGQQKVTSGQQKVSSGQQKVSSGQQKIADEHHKKIENSKNQIDNIEEYRRVTLKYCVNPKTAKEISRHLKIKSRQYISSNIIKPLINEGKLEYTNKNRVNAKNQKYVTKR